MLSRLIALIFIIMLFPVYLVLALLVWITCGHPIFFLQNRVGKEGRVFRIFKFRTMILGAEKQQVNLRKLNEAHEPAFKIYDDPRLTTIGKFMFHTGLDELPQLFNVLRGEMDLVGPRPLPVNEEKLIEEKYKKNRRKVKPGIMSPWILNGYHELTFDEWMISDVNYVAKKNCLHDMVLLIRGGILMVKLVIREAF